MTATTATSRSLTDILAICRRAALQRIAERHAAVLKVVQAMEATLLPSMHQTKLDDAMEAQSLAVEALALVDAEIAAFAGTSTGTSAEPEYKVASIQGMHRYAAQLMLDDPALSPQEALRQAQADDNVRFEAYCVRNGIGQNDDLEGDSES